MDFGYSGNTWWSKKWLKTLLQNAQSETITTALRYFSRGQLSSLEIADNRIVSHVRGPNGGSHDNYIVFPKIPKEKTDVLVSLLKQQPTELRALSNDTLNQSLELLLSKCGITLFDSADAVKMGCDCKDSQPCKYVITTFLGIAKEMVDNPFVLFKIHGMDIEFLKDLKIEQTEVMEAPYESALVQGVRGVPTEKDDLIADQESSNGRVPEINFDEWHNYSRILPAMLQNFPDFCPAGNFRKSFADEMEFCRKYYSEFETFYDFAEQFRLYNNKTFMMEGESLQVVHSDGWKWHFIQAKDGQVISSDLSVETAMGALCALSRGNFFMHHVTVRFLHRALMAAFHLVKTGAIYPQVFWIGKDVAQMRWLPAEMLPDVLAVVAEFEKFAPASIALLDRDEDRQLLLSPAEHILSLFIGQLLRFARKFKPQSQKSKHENLLVFFFNCISGKLANNAHAIPGKIQQWFSVYSSLDFRAQILFSCSEIGNEIALDVFVLDDTGTGSVRTPLAALFESNDSRLLSILSILNGIAEAFKPMEKYLERKASSSIIMHGAELLDFLQNSLKKLEVLGIQAELPKSLMNVGRPKTQMRVQGTMSYGAFKAQDLLDFDWEVAIGDEEISAEEFLKLAKNAEGLLKYKSQYIRITDEDLKNLQERVEKKQSGEPDKEITQAKLVQACLTGQCESVGVTLTDQMKSQIEAWRGESEIELPTGLNATLRPYQLRGYSWMYKNLDMGFGCILADDMGLGKTLQVITYLLKIKQEGKLDDNKALVVLPAGLLCNWQMEIRKFAPELTFMPYHGGSRDLQKFNADVLLTTYATFRKDVDKLKERQWQVVIIDEAQNIKNADSDQSKLLRSIQAPMKIAMSGTPVENRLLEFWTIMDFCNRGILPSASEFHERFEIPIQKNGSQPVAEQFRKITAPFMLRRLKTDKSIISDLPDKIIQDEYAELTKSQAILYKTTLDKFLADLELEEMMREQAAATSGVSDGGASGAGNSSFKRKGIILQMILALKQICNHPATYIKGTRREVAGSRNEAQDSSENSATELEATPVLESGKLQMLIDLLRTIQEQGEKTIIFTQFTEMGNLLKSSIKEELGIAANFYHGGCTQSQRNSMVQDFQENPESKVLILSLKAAGTGLNLTAASQVIHYDLWWNPAIEAQATDRAFRIGQKKNVQVHRFITKGTFEEKINALLESKRAIAELTVNAGETWIADLDDSALSEVFGLDNSVV